MALLHLEDALTEAPQVNKLHNIIIYNYFKKK